MTLRPSNSPVLYSEFRIIAAAAACLLLSACSSSDGSSEEAPANGDPETVLPGEPPIVDAPVIDLETGEFGAVGETGTVYDQLLSTGTFTRYLELLDRAALTETLQGDGVQTVFAPTDDAFVALEQVIGEGVVDTFSVADLADRLKYHVLEGNALDSTTLLTLTGQALEMSNDLPAAVNVSETGDILINNATVTIPDIFASNGTVHVIDNVLTPPVSVSDPNNDIPSASTDDISTTLLNQTDYSILLRLIEQSGLTEILQGGNDGLGWTLFAPSDRALELNDVDVFDLDTAESMDLVNAHLYSGRIISENLLDGEIELVGGMAEVVRSEAGVEVGGAHIVGRDRVVGNGIIHYVDAPVTLLAE